MFEYHAIKLSRRECYQVPINHGTSKFFFFWDLNPNSDLIGKYQLYRAPKIPIIQSTQNTNYTEHPKYQLYRAPKIPIIQTTQNHNQLGYGFNFQAMTNDKLKLKYYWVPVWVLLFSMLENQLSVYYLT